MEKARRDSWTMLCRPGNQQGRGHVPQDWWTRGGKKEWNTENPEHHQSYNHPMLKLPRSLKYGEEVDPS
eukprot:5981966-Prorocentrum_lima.AAC.1